MATNLLRAAEGENYEWNDTCIEFAETAEREGFKEPTAKSRMIAAIEKCHEERYRGLLRNVGIQEVFKKGKVKVWAYRNCGHVVVGTSVPQVYPTYQHPQALFEILVGDYQSGWGGRRARALR